MRAGRWAGFRKTPAREVKRDGSRAAYPPPAPHKDPDQPDDEEQDDEHADDSACYPTPAQIRSVKTSATGCSQDESMRWGGCSRIRCNMDVEPRGSVWHASQCHACQHL